MIVPRPAGPRLPAARSLAAPLLLALTLAGCNGDDGSDPVAPFVDPSGEYSVSIDQTTDTCTNQIGTINWGGATLDLQGNTLMIDLPEAPGSSTCVHTAVPYSMNTIQGMANRPLTVGTCNLNESLTLHLGFTATGFSGTYTIRRMAVLGDCSMLPLPCESSGTVSGVPGLGNPACP